MKKLSLVLIAILILPILSLAQVSNSKYSSLIDAGKEAHSSAIVVMEDGELVANYHKKSDDQLINAMSVTKSIVSLAIARLLSDGQLESLNTPIKHFYPEWNQGQKKNITVKHLMNHTSGLQNVTNAMKEIHPAPNLVKLSLAASVVDEPGSTFSYNNKAVNLLSGIIKKASGKPVDKYLEETIFEDLGITEFDWRTDDTGNHYSMSGLQIKATDLAKLGQLVLQKGEWEGQQVIDQQWVNKLVEQGQPHTKAGALLWWRYPEYKRYKITQSRVDSLRDAGASPKIIDRLESAIGNYESTSAVYEKVGTDIAMDLRETTAKTEISPWETESGPIVGYQANGSLGQYIIILPEHNVVGVRMIKYFNGYNRDTDGFGNFSRMVHEIASGQS